MTNRDDTFRDKFRTQDDALTGVVSYILRVPKALWFIAEVADALTALVIDDNWEKVGAVTVEDAIEAASAMLETFQPMIGWIFPVATATYPDNMLPCDGTTYNRVDYPNLYAVLDNAFILDADTFKTPDLENRTIVGSGDLYTVGQLFGEAEHTLIIDEMPSHQHSGIPEFIDTAAGLEVALASEEVPLISANTGFTGGDGAHNNIQPSLGLRYGIVAQ